jgi:hypothetical protein
VWYTPWMTPTKQMANFIVLCNLALSACALTDSDNRANQQPQEASEPTSLPPERESGSPQEIQMLPESSLDHLAQTSSLAGCGGTINTNPFYYPGNGWIYLTCHDPRTGCRPSFCPYGPWGGNPAYAASDACARSCSANTNCIWTNMVRQCPQP